jgi:excisionase family DNA binding protein
MTEQERRGVERYLEVSHVADRLAVSRQFVRDLCRAGKLPASRLGRRWRVRPSDLTEFMERQKPPAENILDS